MQFSITVDNPDEDICVFQDAPGVVCGQVNIYTRKKAELREVDIRLICDELIDMFGSESGNGLYTNLQKTTKTINSWVVLPERPKAHVLEEGTHQYAFEVGLPAGLDATITMRSYKLEYFLEARLKHSSFFKPNEVVRIPIVLTQIPMSQNLHNDDAASLEISPVPNDCPLSMLRPCDVPIGSTPVVEFETLPIDQNFRFTRVTLALEEVVLMARPQRNAVSKSINVTETHISSPDRRPSGSRKRRSTLATLGSGGSSVSNRSSTMVNSEGLVGAGPQSVRRQSNAAAEENKSVFQLHVAHPLVRSKGNKLVGGSTICKVRDLVATPISLPSTAISTLQRIWISRNSHIQVHHQLSYTLEFQKVSNIPAAQQDPVTNSSHPRVLAVSEMYRSIGKSHIIRRDDLPDPSGLPISDDLLSKPRNKLVDLWEIAPRSTEDEPAERSISMTTMAPTEAPFPVLSKPAPVEPTMSFPLPYSDSGALASPAVLSHQPSMPALNPQFASSSSYVSPLPQPLPIHEAPTISTVQSHNSSYPARVVTPTSAAVTQVDPVPASPVAQESAQPGLLQSAQTVSMPVPVQNQVRAASPIGGFHLSAGFPGPAQLAAMGSAGMSPSGNPMFGLQLGHPPFMQPMTISMFNPMMGNMFSPMQIQQQILMFQEQQRMQQQMFFQQIAEQYSMFMQHPMMQPPTRDTGYQGYQEYQECQECQGCQEYQECQGCQEYQECRSARVPLAPLSGGMPGSPRTPSAFDSAVVTPQPTTQDVQPNAAPVDTEPSDMATISPTGSANAPTTAPVTATSTAMAAGAAPVEPQQAEPQAIRERIATSHHLNEIMDVPIDYSSPPPDYEEFAMPPPYDHQSSVGGRR
ncbi:hypothetical protein DL89DRAFT_290814 [Linderina pennispora]|uniref:Arrestin C-terminal-like domain-containing protein n=1 Tax=Linderina pennispora TaxID=61395 RepID=A0A1Y1WHP2_9FUNG|nr:uncharacterized protein DL89DRAFT_290814 [Linderina pennispora]ORX73033.1 hypothetical protein DL89DRAFT_290814 [Linderina pennispora]